MIQTQWVAAQLRQQWPNLDINVEHIRTTGDRVTDLPLSQIGGDGVFVTEIERALQEGRVDLAVHSLKDLPTVQPEGLCAIAVGPREDVRDVLIMRNEVDTALRIGTCSLRRTAQLLRYRPSAQILPLRGNVDTRLRKLEAGEYDAIVLASAGLHRMGLQERLHARLSYFPIEAMLPAPGQGALAVEIRNEPDMHALLAPLQNVVVQAETSAERAFMRRLGAGCYLPVAAYGLLSRDELSLHGLVISLDGQQEVRVHQSMPWGTHSTIKQAEQLGERLAEQALAEGAGEIIRTIDADRGQEQRRV